MTEFDDLLLIALQSAVIMLSILRMNSMYGKVKKMETLGWWCLGTGSASNVLFYLLKEDSNWGSVLFSLGVVLLAVQATQAEWRPYWFNRRKGLSSFDLSACDRRCEELREFREGR